MLILEKEKLEEGLISLYGPTSIGVYMDNLLYWDLQHKFISDTQIDFFDDAELRRKLKDEIQYHETHQHRNRR